MLLFAHVLCSLWSSSLLSCTSAAAEKVDIVH
jgi:hypothetical protein